MNADEALKVCRFAKALSPAQAVDQYTPEAWALVLRNTQYIDAAEALEQLGGEQEWIHVSHIVGRVKRIRRQRVLDFGVLADPPPGHDPDDTAAHQRFLADVTKRVADGTYEPPAPTQVGRRNIAELGHVGSPVLSEARAAFAEAKTAEAASDAAKRALREAKAARMTAAREADRKARAGKDESEVHVA